MAICPRIPAAGKDIDLSAYTSILGHERPIALLETARRKERVAHALLFAGPDGVGKERVAFAFAKALNCTGEESPCDRCPSCTKIEKGNHPDVRLVATEQELIERGKLEAEKARVPSAQIRNAQLDELADLFRHRPYLGGRKVVIVVDADRMNISSQNRFLKTLEEPSDDTVIILLSAHPEALLPTVISRCQALSFGQLTREQIAGYLVENQGADQTRADVLAAMAQGSLGRAVAYIREDGVLEARDRLLEAVHRLSDGDLADVLELARQHGSKRPRLAETLDMLEVIFRDLLFVRLGVDAELIVNRDVVASLEREAHRFSASRLVDVVERIRQTRTNLEINANPTMSLESLLLEMR